MPTLEPWQGYTIAGALLAVAVYFIIKWMDKVETDIKCTGDACNANKKEIKESTELVIKDAIVKFTETADQLDDSIRNMDRNIASMSRVIGIFQAQVELREKAIAEQLIEISKWKKEQEAKNNEFEKRITILETKK